MTFDEFWKHYVGGDKDKSLETGRIYAASAWDYQQARIEALEAAATDVVECGVDAMAYDRRQVLDALAALLQEPTK